MKKVLILTLLLLVCGCSAKYELSINNQNVKETLSIYGVTSEIPIMADLVYFNTHDYTKEVNNENVEYQTSYNFINFNTSDFLLCFDSYNFSEKEDSYTLMTGKKFKCLPYQYSDYEIINYDRLEIVLSTNHDILNNNADKVQFGKYYWYIDKNNINDAEIYFEISKKSNNILVSIPLLIFFGILIVVGIIIYVIIHSKSNKNNTI